MTTLVLAPILALTVASATQSSVSVTHAATAARTVAPSQSAINHLVVSELREPQTDAPSAVPAPVIKLLSKPRLTAPAPVKAAPPAAPPANPNSVIGIIEAAAARWGVSGSWMVSIARCESGLRPNADNPRGPYIGLFQFLQSTFRNNGGTNINDAADQANIAAKMLAHGQAHQWSCA
jgi:soluble lytic murein transglycosylase-like protein